MTLIHSLGWRRGFTWMAAVLVPRWNTWLKAEASVPPSEYLSSSPSGSEIRIFLTRVPPGEFSSTDIVLVSVPNCGTLWGESITGLAAVPSCLLPGPCPSV